MIHCNSQTIDANALYSASEEDLETLFRFLDFHEMRESPRYTQYPMIDFVVSGHRAQSEFEKALSCIDEEAERIVHGLGWTSGIL